MKIESIYKTASHFLRLAVQQNCSQSGCNNTDNLIMVLDGDPPGPYCKHHLDWCKDCKHPVSWDNSWSKGDNHYCKSCYDKRFNVCANCSAIEYNGTIAIPKTSNDDPDENWCHRCWNASYTNCPSCNKVSERTDLLQTTDPYNKSKTKTGCRSCMAECHDCEKVLDRENEDWIHRGLDNKEYCHECFHDRYFSCDNCNGLTEREHAHYAESASDQSFCRRCFERNFTTCNECLDYFDNDSMTKYRGEWYCEKCIKTQRRKTINKYNTLEPIQFNKNDRLLLELKRSLPISIKNLKTTKPSLALALKDLIAFANGKDLTIEIVSAFEQKLQRTNYNVAYSTWDEDLQRSVESEEPQLVLHIIAGDEMIDQMKNDGSYFLLEKINEVSNQSSHPMVKNQIGWARLELHDEEKYILIDEIQTDHMNALDRIKKETHDGKTYETHIKQKHQITDDRWNQICLSLKSHIKDFNDVAVNAITKFAKENGYTKIYYHTLESGKALKQNSPPESLYKDTPKKHFFNPTQEKPFGLQQNFLSREARRKFISKLLKR